VRLDIDRADDDCGQLAMLHNYMFLLNNDRESVRRQVAEPDAAASCGLLARIGLIALDLLLLPLLPFAVWWVRGREAEILRGGDPLDEMQLSLAHAIGVATPERVRVMAAACVPMPLPSMVRHIAERWHWLSPHIAGMTLGHGIVLRSDCRDDPRLLAHELKHVAQYQRYARDSLYGRHAGFLRRHLRECVWPGYPHGPLEAEARRAEAIAARYSRSTGRM